MKSGLRQFRLTYSNIDIGLELSKKLGIGYHSENHTRTIAPLHRGMGEMKDHYTLIYLDWDDFLGKRSFLGFLYKLESVVGNLREMESQNESYKFYKFSDWLTKEIEDALSLGELELGISFNASEGVFYPSGDEILDKELVNENLQALDIHSYAIVSVPFKKGLRFLLEGSNDSEKLQDAITNVYEALETFAKVVCENERDLSGNADGFVQRLGFSKNEHYRKMFKEYIAYANHYRHGKKEGETRPRPSLVYAEVEAFVYLSGLFIRLGIEKLKPPSPSAREV